MKDIDFLIPLYVDHEDRINNINIVVKTLRSFGFEKIYVKEYYTDHPKFDNQDVHYSSEQMVDKFFNKMTCINEMLEYSESDYISIYDSDVIFPKSSLMKSLELLNNGADVVYPYDGRFYNIPKKVLKEFIINLSIDLESCELANPNSWGGAVIFNKEKFIEGGKCNPNFKNVGYDDNEIFIRFRNLGYDIQRVSGVLFHMEHERTFSSVEHNEFINYNMEIYNNINRMSKTELLEEIKNWN